MSTPFAPARASTPPHSHATRSAVSDVSRSSALSIAELATLTPDEIEFLDAVISRAPASATTFIHIFKAYNEVISERGLDAENEVDYYKKLLKIGTLKGENWASKWRAVKAQNGYIATSTPARTRPPLHNAAPQAHLPPSKVASVTPPAQSSTARLLQRLKALQHETPPDLSESAPDDLVSRFDVTDTETDSPARTAPAPTHGRPSARFTTTDNTLGLDVGSNPGYPPSSTLAPSKSTGWHWPERDPDIDKSVPFLTSTPPLSPYKPAARPTPASARQPVLHHVPTSSAPYKSLTELRTPKLRTADEDVVWSKVRVEQDERSADQFRNMQLLQRCFDVWKQGYDWVIVRFFCSISAFMPHNLAKFNPLPPTSRRQRQLKSLMPVILSFSASLFTSGVLLWCDDASECPKLMPAQVHLSRRWRLFVGTCTCRKGEKQRGVPICACVCRQCEVCAMVRCAGTRGRAGASSTRAALCNSALPCASSSVISSDGRIRSERWM